MYIILLELLYSQGYLVNWDIERQVWDYLFGKDALKVLFIYLFAPVNYYRSYYRLSLRMYFETNFKTKEDHSVLKIYMLD